MALTKRNYVDKQTIITAQNLNDIQDNIIQNTEDISQKYEKPVNGIPENDLNIEVQNKLNSDVDVQINGTSIVRNGVANIPPAGTSNDTAGVVAVNSGYGIAVFEVGRPTIRTSPATNDNIISRGNGYRVITPQNLDLAVKTAMCDGKGAAWTAAEQLAAQARLGIISSEGVGF